MKIILKDFIVIMEPRHLLNIEFWVLHVG